MFNLNGIDSCAIIILLAVNTCALHNSNKGLFNVGTVLFTTNDLNNKKWSKTNTELLQARRYFQSIIPSPSMDSLNDDYVNNLLIYFTNAFSTLKREAIDSGTTNVMQKALADAVGGYLKVWVLPVTKLTYYGGAISQDNAVKVFKLYEKLKRSLNTDGSGWQKPSEIILNTIAIKVVPYYHVPHTRSMKYPCEHLAYYEKSDTGLTIPVPYINWNEAPYSMFLPLKNESLIQLDAPYSSNALLKYYDIAESCCQLQSPEACNEFHSRFQNWLTNNFVPHINDDNLYIAFGSLLSLVNKTNNFIQKTYNLYKYDYDKFTLNSLYSRLSPCMNSNKFLILILILIVEIVWCIPALIYIICSRRKARMKQQTKYFLDTFNRPRYHTDERIDKTEEKNYKKDPKKVNQICQSHIMGNSVKPLQKPQENNAEIDTQYPSHTSKRSVGEVTSFFSDINNEAVCQYESVTLINEKVGVNTVHSSHAQLVVLPKDIKNTNQSERCTKVHKFETTITKIIRDKSESDSKPCVRSSSSNKTIKKITSEVKQKLQELEDNDEIVDMCPCIRCIEEKRSNMEAQRNARLREPRAVKVNLTGKTAPRNVTHKTKLPKLQPKIYAPKNIKLNQSRGFKIISGEPLLEIRIDRPATEITVDITKTCRKNAKPSKIPRLAAATTAKEQKTLNPTPRNVKPCIYVHQTSKLVKKCSVDDMDINRKMGKHNKLNITF